MALSKTTISNVEVKIKARFDQGDALASVPLKSITKPQMNELARELFTRNGWHVTFMPRRGGGRTLVATQSASEADGVAKAKELADRVTRALQKKKAGRKPAVTPPPPRPRPGPKPSQVPRNRGTRGPAVRSRSLVVTAIEGQVNAGFDRREREVRVRLPDRMGDAEDTLLQVARRNPTWDVNVKIEDGQKYAVVRRS